MARGAHVSLAGGEIGRQVRARFDVAKYGTGLDKARNTIGLPGGGQYIRPGFRFCGETYLSSDVTRLFPFAFGVNDAYALEFGDETMRVWRDGGLVLQAGLIVTAATQANPLVVTINCHGLAIGRDVYFSGIEGMTELNGRTLRVTAVPDANNVTFGGVNSTGWGAFTGSGGGVDGCAITPPTEPEPFDPGPRPEPPTLPLPGDVWVLP